MISEKFAKQYCCEDISKIENYDKAITDTTQTWECHHRMELMETGAVVDATIQDLVDWGIYYQVPAADLIFLTQPEHKKLHARNFSKERNKKIAETMKGRKLSKETRRKLSEINKGRVYKEEWKIKLSESHKGKHWKLIGGKHIYY